ncbi:NAD(P)/FAD-dependent oxidoreductase [Spirochaeta africana]|uniref:NADH:ubiquinone reductase (non-electrogenic) n=1 Tax=Spirochaeta africana (strain ATCC 700263 / DSM 8902 / Z-7692) TaxID=889378 RepID=H9UF96_SPIAZ|nr:NAD(P)/FAD-dependent oxidoreductase [Spirochaeta africana]AFG36189.1 NADH dehydrogenase, FAD-containing subunit [Spirochaeta africana DSM 8902]
MSETKRIVILGGGYGGVEAAKKLYKKFKKKKHIEITLIDKNPYHTLMTELHEVAGSRTEQEAVEVSFAKIFGGTSVTVVSDYITSVDFEAKKLQSDSASYEYDHLILGTGGEPEFFGIPGVQENSYTLWSLEDAIRIKERVENRFREAARQADPDKRKRMLTFAIAGAGFTGVELAGELAERRETLCRDYHIDPNEVRIVIIEAMGTVLPSYPDKPRQKAEKYMKKIGLECMLNSPIVGADEEGVSLADGSKLLTDTFIWTAGIQGSEFTARINLTKGKHSKDECSYASAEGIHGMAGCRFDEDERYIVGERGRILVNEYMQSVDYKDVYLVGDMIWFLEGDHVVPQIVETAIQTAEVAVHNLVSDINGGEKKAFKSNYHGNMVSIGGKYGVAHVMGVSMWGFPAMAMKHLVNVHYLFSLAGVNAVWNYLQHEFFRIREKRSIMRGHMAAKLPTYWALPLRVFLGYKWLNEGLKKVMTGWLDPGAGGVFDADPGRVYLPGLTFWGDASGATSATPAEEVSGATSATAAANGGGGDGSWGQPILEESLAIYDWFAATVLSIHPSVAFLAQSGVVIAQVVVGIFLILGLFTIPAALASIAMGVMFIVSGWGNTELWWYLTASLVMLGGAGKGFGLDHTVMPLIKKFWNGTTLAKKTYLYVDEPRLKK